MYELYVFLNYFFKDLQNREKELKLLRKDRNINNGGDESDSESEILINRKLRTSKSIGELYEALWHSNSKRLFFV